MMVRASMLMQDERRTIRTIRTPGSTRPTGISARRCWRWSIRIGHLTVHHLLSTAGDR